MCICSDHGRFIKLTQHIGFLTLAGMERVIEGNHGNDVKEGQQEFCVYRVWQNLIIVYRVLQGCCLEIYSLR